MCLTSSIALACNNDTGGIATIYLAQKVDADGIASAFTFATTPNAPNVTAVNVGLDWVKIDLSGRETLSQQATSPRNDNNSYSQNIAFQFSGFSQTTAADLYDLNDCNCGYLAIVVDNNGRSFLYGVNYYKTSGTYINRGIYPAAADAYNSGANATETATTSVALAGVTSNPPLFVNAGVIATLTVI